MMASVTLPQAHVLPYSLESLQGLSDSQLRRSFDELHRQSAKVGGVRAPKITSLSLKQVVQERVGGLKSRVVCAIGDVSSAGTTYLIARPVAIAVIGTAFPFILSRGDTSPECDGARFVRGVSGGGALRVNVVRKDQAPIV